MSTCTALVVAGGRGSRFGEGLPKQYRFLSGQPILRRAVRPFLAHRAINAVRVVIHADDNAAYESAVGDLPLLTPVHGGSSRQESVFCGLKSLEADRPDLVLIHDAARPFVSSTILDRIIAALEYSDGAVPALPIVDTTKYAPNGSPPPVVKTLDRSGLWRAQTPQGFRFPQILAAHRQLADLSLTDDSSLGERVGLRVVLVAGAEENFKITTEDDLRRAERLLNAMHETRTGTGFDAHRFREGDHVMLCGLRIPHNRGLLGHSDADVGLHALTDALLATVAAGDIGSHFPPSDPKWRGAPSDTFIRHALSLISASAGRIVNVDVTLICERPKIAAYRQAMRQRVAELLAVEVSRVSVKATTTEGLGFTGRKEGVAAQAVATVCVPTTIVL